VLGHGRLVFEENTADTLAESLAALETGIADWFQRAGQ
jgi:hypothetical protein